MAIKDREISVLLEIVRDFDNAGISLTGIDMNRLIRLSYRHKVVYPMLLFAQKHQDFFSHDQIEKLNERNRKVARQSLIQLQEMKKIAGILAEKDIPFVCIKGPQLSRMLYGREALKESVDLDIVLVNSDDLLPVHGIFRQLGYSESNLNDYPSGWRRKIFLIAKREVHYFNKDNKTAIDLHIRPGANTYLTAKYFKGFLTELKSYDLEGTSLPVLRDEAYFVYLCYHGALHQFMRLAWLLDIRAFLHLKFQTVNFEKARHIAATINVERCVYLALFLLEQYFGDDFSVTQFSIRSNRIKKLATRCQGMLSAPPDYAISLQGRFDKVVYIMKLIRGFPGKIDWIYGIVMRQIIKLIK